MAGCRNADSYFWDKWDPHYHTVLSMHDPGEKDLTAAWSGRSTGKGNYIYTGLLSSRQLPEGNAGAFRLFVNLISQSRNKPAAAQKPQDNCGAGV